MPGAEYDGNEPSGFMPLSEVVMYFDDYITRFGLPVRCGVEVFRAERIRDGYGVRTSDGDYHAENVVIATGLYQPPKIPEFSAAIPQDVLQIHSGEYRNPSSLKDGAVLVVGTGQSGAQIAEELYQRARTVYLSIGSAGRVPRRSRGKDINDWFTRLGTFDTKVAALKSPRDRFSPHPQISGKNGGHPHPRLRNRHSLPRAVSNGAHPSDYAAKELWTKIFAPLGDFQIPSSSCCIPG